MLDRLPPAGSGVVAAVDDVGRLRLDDGSAVRLAGLGDMDRAALAEMVQSRRVDLLLAGEGAGRHVRLQRGRAWVQGRLLEQGAARVRPDTEELALADAMLSREARARQAARGGWASRWRVLIAAEAEGARGWLIVEGRVRAAARSRRGQHLDFGVDWRRDFSVEVRTDDLDAFARAGEEPLGLRGRLVRVRGEVKPSPFDPVMRLTTPAALEVLDEP